MSTPRLPLSDRDRLTVQLYGLTAASMDLRGRVWGVDRDAFRDLVRDLRAIRNRAFTMLPHVSTHAADWARFRLEVRLGIKPAPAYVMPEGQRLEEHTQESDLRLLLEWLEATS